MTATPIAADRLEVGNVRWSVEDGGERGQRIVRRGRNDAGRWLVEASSIWWTRCTIPFTLKGKTRLLGLDPEGNVAVLNPETLGLSKRLYPRDTHHPFWARYFGDQVELRDTHRGVFVPD